MPKKKQLMHMHKLIFLNQLLRRNSKCNGRRKNISTCLTKPQEDRNMKSVQKYVYQRICNVFVYYVLI